MPDRWLYLKPSDEALSPKLLLESGITGVIIPLVHQVFGQLPSGPDAADWAQRLDSAFLLRAVGLKVLISFDSTNKTGKAPRTLVDWDDEPGIDKLLENLAWLRRVCVTHWFDGVLMDAEFYGPDYPSQAGSWLIRDGIPTVCHLIQRTLGAQFVGHHCVWDLLRRKEAYLQSMRTMSRGAPERPLAFWGWATPPGLQRINESVRERIRHRPVPGIALTSLPSTQTRTQAVARHWKGDLWFFAQAPVSHEMLGMVKRGLGG